MITVRSSLLCYANTSPESWDWTVSVTWLLHEITITSGNLRCRVCVKRHAYGDVACRSLLQKCIYTLWLGRPPQPATMVCIMWHSQISESQDAIRFPPTKNKKNPTTETVHWFKSVKCIVFTSQYLWPWPYGTEFKDSHLTLRKQGCAVTCVWSDRYTRGCRATEEGQVNSGVWQPKR